MKMLLISTVLFNAYSCLPPPVVDPPAMDASMAVDMLVAGTGTLGIGDPCTTTSECSPGLFCERWCSKACTQHADCAAAVVPSECAQDTTSFSCHPRCSAAADCAPYSASCAFGTAPAGQFGTQICQ